MDKDYHFKGLYLNYYLYLYIILSIISLIILVFINSEFIILIIKESHMSYHLIDYFIKLNNQ